MIRRTVIVTIDTIIELFKDYLPKGDIPEDCQPLNLRFKPADRGRLAIEVESSHWKGNDLSPLVVKFDLRKIFSVGK